MRLRLIGMIGHADKYEASKTPGMATDITDIQNSSQKLRVSKIVAKIWLGSDRVSLIAITYFFDPLFYLQRKTLGRHNEQG